MSSNFEDRIRLLTDRAIAATTQNELEAILPELKAAIRDHVRCVRAIALETLPATFGKQEKPAASSHLASTTLETQTLATATRHE